MSSVNIYSILRSKSSNEHLIKRYIKFISLCNHSPNEYVEDHHICPKADDLFPEYIDLNIHTWNLVKLTSRQHIIAHVMLWKIFGGSQTLALDCMLGKFNSNTNELLVNRIIPTSITIRYHAKLREETKKYLSEIREGFACYKDENNNKFVLHKDDPKIKELNLVGNNKGHIHREDSKKKMSATKYPSKRVKMYFLDCEISVKLFSPEFSDYLAQGWTTSYTEEDMQWVKDFRYSNHSDKMKGRTRYCLPDGSYYGMLYKDDPKIEEMGLMVQYTENNKKQLESIRHLGAESLIGTKIYNNGEIEARFHETPADKTWKLGRLPRSESHSKNQKEAARKAQQGKKAWNDGVVCKRFPDGFNPGEGWVLGLLPRNYN